jgi:hypothetical protein
MKKRQRGNTGKSRFLNNCSTSRAENKKPREINVGDPEEKHVKTKGSESFRFWKPLSFEV